MAGYLARQTVISLIKLFLFVSLMFFFIQIMMPGDYVDQLAVVCNASCRESLRAQLGLDLSLWQRYLQWLRQIITLDLGNSFNGEPIVEILKKVVPATLLVFFTGTILAFLFGLWLGKRTAWRNSATLSRASTLVGLLMSTSFPPWLTWLVAYIFTQGAGFVVMGETGGLGTATFVRLDRTVWAATKHAPSAVALYMIASLAMWGLIIHQVKMRIEQRLHRSTPGSLYLIGTLAAVIGSWYLLGIAPFALDILRLAWIPLLTYVLLSFGETMLIMQTSMDEVMRSEYIQTARAKGIPDSVIRERHAARNALLPVVSRLVISLPYLITGVVIIESSVDWPGMGTTLWNALYWQNMPVVMNTLLIVSVLSLAARLLLDVISTYLDPRIRYGTSSMPTR